MILIIYNTFERERDNMTIGEESFRWKNNRLKTYYIYEKKKHYYNNGHLCVGGSGALRRGEEEVVYYFFNVRDLTQGFNNLLPT